MNTIDYLKTAQKSEKRSEKVKWLFDYLKSKQISKTYNAMIELVGYTDEQIDLEVENYLERELSLKRQEDKTKLPFNSLYVKYLNIASIRFNMTLDECRDKYGLFTIKQWEDEFAKTY